MTHTHKERAEKFLALDELRTQGEWGIGYINDDLGVADVIATDNPSEIIAEEVAIHNSGFIAEASKMPDLIRELLLENGRLRERLDEVTMASITRYMTP